jgi:hypothetical protein
MKNDGVDQYKRKESFAQIAKAYLDQKQAIDEGRDPGNTGASDRTIALDTVLKSQFERAFGVDFSDVRIHSGPYSDELTRSAHADAVTVGNDIYFHEGKYSPDTEEGRSLLAHELTHFVQFKQDARMVYIEDIAAVEDEATATEMMMGVLNLHHVSKPYLKKDPDTEISHEPDEKASNASAVPSKEAPPTMKEFGTRRDTPMYRITFSGSGKVYTLSKEEREKAIERAVRLYRKFIEDESALLPEEEREKVLLKNLSFLSGM